MRPNNQKQRSRGRNNNNNRKHSNPLSRNFESNGPDVKIRGNAAHIAEKYVQLARDAQTSGDSVMAENYFQHAEHYNRIVSAAQAQNAQRIEQAQAQQPQITEESGSAQAPNAETREETDVEAAQPSADVAGETPAVVAEEAEAPRKRERRPRRKPRVAEEAPAAAAQVSATDADGPQPDVGDLPAFLTGGQSTAAE